MLQAQLSASETLGFLLPSEESFTHILFFMEAVLMQWVEQPSPL